MLYIQFLIIVSCIIHQYLVRAFLTICFKNVAGCLNSGQINADIS